MTDDMKPTFSEWVVGKLFYIPIIIVTWIWYADKRS